MHWWAFFCVVGWLLAIIASSKWLDLHLRLNDRVKHMQHMIDYLQSEADHLSTYINEPKDKN